MRESKEAPKDNRGGNIRVATEDQTAQQTIKSLTSSRSPSKKRRTHQLIPRLTSFSLVTCARGDQF